MKFESAAAIFAPLLREYYEGNRNSRAEKFVEWLEKNDVEITYGLNNALAEGRIIPGAFWRAEEALVAIGIWLGGTYLCSTVPEAKGVARLPEVDLSNSGGGFRHEDMRCPNFFWDVGGSRVAYGAPDEGFEPDGTKADWATLFVSGVNVGLHEFTHALLHMLGKGDMKVLGEIAATCTQLLHGLPVRKSEAANPMLGARNPSVMGQAGMGFDQANDYFSNLLASWIKAHCDRAGKTLDITAFECTGSLNQIGDADNMDRKFRILKNGNLKFVINERSFFRCSGMESGLDKEAKGKLMRVFRKLKGIEFQDFHGFLAKFKTLMDEEFGEQDDGKEIPEGFVRGRQSPMQGSYLS
ncbi:MAG: hypothetical protein WC488_05130 [Candidatus Micrarchaeia archaeon]